MGMRELTEQKARDTLSVNVAVQVRSAHGSSLLERHSRLSALLSRLLPAQWNASHVSSPPRFLSLEACSRCARTKVRHVESGIATVSFTTSRRLGATLCPVQADKAQQPPIVVTLSLLHHDVPRPAARESGPN
ncbi:unnamed protein product [Lota lota]